VKVRVEAAKCEGFGICATHSPEVFLLDEWGYASVRGDGEIATGEESQVQRAIADCPAHAIVAE
jgi:ferredoxin